MPLEIEVEGLRKTFGRREVLKGLTFSLERGGVLSIFGPNGGGKTTTLRVLATLLPQRSPLAPDAPTMAEAGAPKLSIVPWAGFFGPAKLPADIVARLNRELTAIFKRPEVREQIERQAFEVQGSTPEELAAHTKEQVEVWKTAVRDSGMALE